MKINGSIVTLIIDRFLRQRLFIFIYRRSILYRVHQWCSGCPSRCQQIRREGNRILQKSILSPIIWRCSGIVWTQIIQIIQIIQV